MQKFKKKPVVIDAVQWDGTEELADQIASDWVAPNSGITIMTHDGCDSVFIETLEGEMEAKVGDWVIRGVAGELYPCKPEIFAATYELADNTKYLQEANHNIAADQNILESLLFTAMELIREHDLEDAFYIKRGERN